MTVKLMIDSKPLDIKVLLHKKIEPKRLYPRNTTTHSMILTLPNNLIVTIKS